MSRPLKMVFVTDDTGLIKHWERVFGKANSKPVLRFAELNQDQLNANTIVWMDVSVHDAQAVQFANWSSVIKIAKVIAASSSPNDKQAIQALDAGCVAYCHAFADSKTLSQVKQVVEAGQVWIGTQLMQRLIKSASQAISPNKNVENKWADCLTQREREIAILAANGASNSAISTQCHISERTVKAHLSAIFEKLSLTDRLQLALRVHGIS